MVLAPPATAQLNAAGWQSWSVNILMHFLIYWIGLMSLAFVGILQLSLIGVHEQVTKEILLVF